MSPGALAAAEMSSNLTQRGEHSKCDQLRLPRGLLKANKLLAAANVVTDDRTRRQDTNEGHV